jgi:pimeloyl-ACP methyl ester carboxylesterase
MTTDPLARAKRHVVPTNGIRMSVLEQGDGPAVVLSHGFPELAYSWRHQIAALADAGFRVLAPDQRGYGDTDRPAAVESYDIHHLTGDLVGLLDALGIEQAVFVGHDWGGIVVWHMPLLHPTRTAGVVGVNTPAFPRAPAPPIAIFRAMFGDDYYVVHFQEPGVADAQLARDPRRVFTQLMRRPVPLEEFAARAFGPDGKMRSLVDAVYGEDAPGEPLLDADELETYVRAFAKSGFTGGINWYRNLDRNWETTPGLVGARIEVPSLMVTAELDPVLRPEMAAQMASFVTDLETVMIPGSGHWTQQEKPDELNRVLIDWLERRHRPPRGA